MGLWLFEACGEVIVEWHCLECVLCGYMWGCVCVWVCGCVGMWACGCVGVFVWVCVRGRALAFRPRHAQDRPGEGPLTE